MPWLSLEMAWAVSTALASVCPLTALIFYSTVTTLQHLPTRGRRLQLSVYNSLTLRRVATANFSTSMIALRPPRCRLLADVALYLTHDHNVMDCRGSHEARHPNHKSGHVPPRQIYLRPHESHALSHHQNGRERANTGYRVRRFLASDSSPSLLSCSSRTFRRRASKLRHHSSRACVVSDPSPSCARDGITSGSLLSSSRSLFAAVCRLFTP